MNSPLDACPHAPRPLSRQTGKTRMRGARSAIPRVLPFVVLQAGLRTRDFSLNLISQNLLHFCISGPLVSLAIFLTDGAHGWA